MKLKPNIRKKKFFTGEQVPAELGVELTPEILQGKLLTGEAHYLGTLKQGGEIHDYYSVEVDGRTTYIYSVR